MSVGGIEIDDVFDARFWDEGKIIGGEVAMGVDNAVALVVIDVAECEQREKAGFTGAGLTDDVDMTRAVAAIHTKLMFDAAEIR